MAANNDGPRSVFTAPSTSGERAARNALTCANRDIDSYRRQLDAAILSLDISDKELANESRITLERAINVLLQLTDVSTTLEQNINTAIRAGQSLLGEADPFNIDAPDPPPIPNPNPPTAQAATDPLVNPDLTPVYADVASEDSGSVITVANRATNLIPRHPLSGLGSESSFQTVESTTGSVNQQEKQLEGSATPGTRHTADLPRNDAPENDPARNGSLEQVNSLNAKRFKLLTSRHELERQLEAVRQESELVDLEIDTINSVNEVLSDIGSLATRSKAESIRSWVGDACARTRAHNCTRTPQTHVAKPTQTQPPARETTRNLSKDNTRAHVQTAAHAQVPAAARAAAPPAPQFTPAQNPPAQSPSAQNPPVQNLHQFSPQATPFYPPQQPVYYYSPGAQNPLSPAPQVIMVPTPSSPNDVNTRLLNAHLQSNARDLIIQRRPAKSDRFAGKAQDFEAFFTQFEAVTDVDGVNDQIKYAELKHWTVGAANLAVGQFDTEKDSSKALKGAKAHLRKLFGRKLTTAKEMMDEVLSGAKLHENDFEAIDILILKIENTYRVACESNKEATFSTRETYRDILAKLPPMFTRKWAVWQTDSDDKYAESENPTHILGFSDFVRFCRRQNTINSNYRTLQKDAPPPRNSNSGAKPQGQKKVAATEISVGATETSVAATTTSRPHKKPGQNRTPNQQKKTFASAAATPPNTAGNTWQPKKPPNLMPAANTHSETGKKCQSCKTSNHSLDQCCDFLKKSYNDKKDIVLKNGLCFVCLVFGHLAESCTADVRCKQCEGKHNTAFHRNKPAQQDTEGQK